MKTTAVSRPDKSPFALCKARNFPPDTGSLMKGMVTFGCSCSDHVHVLYTMGELLSCSWKALKSTGLSLVMMFVVSNKACFCSVGYRLATIVS